MKKVKAFFKKLSAIIDDLFSVQKYVDAGILDFSGQGRDKYGN